MSVFSARFIKTVAGAAAFCASLVSFASTRVEAQPTLVIVVRHGEKQPTPNDPSLSEAGVARSLALDSAIAHSTPGTIVVSATKRTAETAAAVAKRTGVTPTVIALQGAHVKNVADAVMKASGVVLVVGHSNTVPAIVTALGGPKLPDICDASYDTMFIVTPARDGKPVQVVQSSYGKADAVGADQCAPPR
ncbi:MAG: histidine phosphatase family protein [Gemmatimonadaceae bacterium]|nr:histidine phosphatase family protein [Gemmatimonadaceae bacterium]